MTDQRMTDQPMAVDEHLDYLAFYINYHTPDGESNARDSLAAIRAALAEKDAEIEGLRNHFVEAVMDLNRTAKQRDLLFEYTKKDTAEIERLRNALQKTLSLYALGIDAAHPPVKSPEFKAIVLEVEAIMNEARAALEGK